MIKDFPKIESPFKRKLNEEGEYLIYDEIEPGMEWVFEDQTVLATEKLHGTNVSIIVENGQITQIYNRTARIPFFNKAKRHIIEGIMESFKRDFIDRLGEGQHFGELIGERVNGNPHKIKGHLWIPFETYAKDHLAYKSWGKYPKTFQAISDWLEKDIFSLFGRMHDQEKSFPEGIVFVHPDGRMVKIRRDMFSWFTEKRHKETEAEK